MECCRKSPDIIPFTFLFCGFVKDEVYAPAPPLKKLKRRIRESAEADHNASVAGGRILIWHPQSNSRPSNGILRERF
jgi:hypothetical protein